MKERNEAMGLEGKTAVITGGAGFIGKAIAARLGAEGAKIVLADINADALETARDALAKGGVECDAFAGDIAAGPESAIGLMRRAVERFGGLNVLVNCAGGSARGENRPFHEQRMEIAERILRTNLLGMLYCAHAAIPYMVEKRHGKIITISSIVALRGKAGHVDYAAAKGGVISASRALAVELGRYNINVNCIAPGLVNRRPFASEADETAFARRTTWLNRVCAGEDIGELACFLASPASDFITGQNYVVDGGRSLMLKGDGN